MRITGIYTYPVKGCHRVAHAAAEVEPWGLAGDRRWLMAGADGVALTQREHPRLALLTVRPRPGGLELAAPGRPTLTVDEPANGPEELVRVFRHRPAAPTRVAETDWTSEFLGRPARLVWQAEPTGRVVPREAFATEPVSLADAFPLSLATEASLAAVNDWLVESGDEPVPMSRFRPNLVIGGAQPWAEDRWIGRRLRAGDVVLRAAAPCGRCVVTTIDQDTAERGRQPLRALGRHRRFGDRLLFAIHLVPEGRPRGPLRVGDPVTVLD